MEEGEREKWEKRERGGLVVGTIGMVHYHTIKVGLPYLGLVLLFGNGILPPSVVQRKAPLYLSDQPTI